MICSRKPALRLSFLPARPQIADACHCGAGQLSEKIGVMLYFPFHHHVFFENYPSDFGESIRMACLWRWAGINRNDSEKFGFKLKFRSFSEIVAGIGTG
jgi:hypothetical protein